MNLAELVDELYEVVRGETERFDVEVTIHGAPLDTINKVKDVFKGRLIASDELGSSCRWVWLRDVPGSMPEFRICMFYPHEYVPKENETKQREEVKKV